MEFSLNRIKPGAHRTDCLVLGVLDGNRMLPSTKAADEALDGCISGLLSSSDLGEKTGSMLLHNLADGPSRRVLLVRLGKQKALDGKTFAKAVQGVWKKLAATGAKTAAVCLAEAEVNGRQPAWTIRQLVLGAERSSYRFDEYKSKKAKNQSQLRRIQIHLADAGHRRKLQGAIDQGRCIASGEAEARRLGDLPGNACTPSYLATRARQLGRKHEKLSVSVLDEKKMKDLGMHSLLSVSAGSEQPARLIVLEYTGGKPGAKPEVLIGKGITFDTGGISLKPGLNMDEMKYDMCGAASVMGTLRAVAEMNLPVNVTGIIAAAENMPSGRATKPGDIVTTMSGQTVEILNTDAEGRLVLCDALTYAERFKPAHVIDIATLTGACVVALGKIVSGLFTTDDKLASDLVDAGEQALDPTWRLPLMQEYQELLDSNFADMANIGGPYAGATTAACFLSRYTKAFSWAHLDIAGVAWKSGAEKGATGRPVPLLCEYLLARA